MPVYEYACQRCGPFEAFRPMAEFDQPSDCDICGAPAPRVMLTAPAFAGMDASRRTAFATNERSANAPHRHTATCGCRPGGAPKKLAAEAVPAAKSFPAKRPWMISH